MSTPVSNDLKVIGTRHLPPEPRLVEALGHNHAIETAVADLVDNSLDASATRILIRFVRSKNRIISLYVVDDGKGMDDAAIDAAMTLGSQRQYVETDLGHFGVGLKAASLGHANSLTVVSRCLPAQACGRRWLKAEMSAGFECEVLDPTSCGVLLERDWGFTPWALSSGTIVRWDDVTSFPATRQSSVVDDFLERTIVDIRLHLGLVFHRLIQKTQVEIDVQDEDTGEVGPAQRIVPIDPFGYSKLRGGRLVKTNSFKVGDVGLDFELHLWPSPSSTGNFRLHGRAGKESQGFFFYRRDRLIQCGGWNGATTEQTKLQLARVKVDLPDEAAHLIRMNPEKTQVRLDPEVVRSLDPHTDVGRRFHEYLDTARDVHKQSQQRSRERPSVVPPGRGFAPTVRKAVRSELKFVAGEEPIEIRWCDFNDDSFFDVDRDEWVIWINRKYRWALNGDRDGSLNDAPLVKAALYLLLENLFQGSHLGSRDKDNIELWSAILGAAAQAEIS